MCHTLVRKTAKILGQLFFSYIWHRIYSEYSYYVDMSNRTIHCAAMPAELVSHFFTGESLAGGGAGGGYLTPELAGWAWVGSVLHKAEEC